MTDPTGREQAERAAMYQRARALMGPPRRFRYGPDGQLHEVTFDDRRRDP